MSYWIKYKDTLECAECGFGYFPNEFYFKNHECLKITREKTIFRFCPDCGETMSEEIKERQEIKQNDFSI